MSVPCKHDLASTTCERCGEFIRFASTDSAEWQEALSRLRTVAIRLVRDVSNGSLNASSAILALNSVDFRPVPAPIIEALREFDSEP